jgi:hypothetical protein
VSKYRTVEAAAEILARELFVEWRTRHENLNGAALPSSAARRDWYTELAEDGRDVWRGRAATVLEQLGRSDLELVWTTTTELRNR